MFFRKREENSASGSPEFMIVGLGNPGREYEYTRHNAGFLTLDRLAVEQNTEIKKLKYKALIGDTVINGHRCLMVKPQTFMNNSGEAVREVSQFYKIPPQKIIVVFDDISLEPGKLRIRRKGTDGGHKGMRSIILNMNSDEIPRIKMGVGAKPHPDYSLADWVLSTFRKEEMEEFKKAVSKAVEVLPYILDGDIEKAMNKANQR